MVVSSIQKEIQISRIRFLNRKDCCGERLTRAKVLIDGQTCGVMPATTRTNVWYDVRCNLTGSTVRLITTTNNFLQISGAQFYIGGGRGGGRRRSRRGRGGRRHRRGRGGRVRRGRGGRRGGRKVTRMNNGWLRKQAITMSSTYSNSYNAFKCF